MKVYGVIFALLALLCLPAVSQARPNFVILLVDDAGLMDFGSFGGEARTPHIDRLAERGMRFGNHHTSPLCAPSRAMLLTGLDNHRTGIGTIPEALTEKQSESAAYAQRLKPAVNTIAELLRDAGYQTYMIGKWHLGSDAGDLPNHHGFDRSLALDASGADNWEQKSYMPFYADAPWYEDGKPATLPDDFYSSRYLVDRMIHYLDARDRARPFLAYVAFQAIHIPVQAPREFTDGYQGVYDDGWDALLAQRVARARELGLMPANAPAPTIHPAIPAWDSLTAAEQAHQTRSMMVNAGMIEAMDHHIGRLIEYLEQSGELDNTVFIVTSDNGPEFNDPAAASTYRLWMRLNGYDSKTERLGERGSIAAIGPGWASAAAAPSSLFKMYAAEGGTRVPLVISGAGKASGFLDALTFVTDLAPTIAELAGLSASDTLSDMDGVSLAPLLRAAAAGRPHRLRTDDDAVGMEVAGNAALYKGRYKLTRNSLPHGDGEWRLHDLRTDPAEVRDLSVELPELRRELLADYERYAMRVQVTELPPDFNIVQRVTGNVAGKYLERNRYNIIGGFALIVLVFLLLIAALLQRWLRHP